MEIYLKRFTVDDWQDYKAIRLEALQLDADKFTASYSEAIAMRDEEWVSRLSLPEWAFWGLYEGEACIGLTGIVEFKEDPTGALFVASYIRKAYRGQGLAAQYFKARMDWAKERGYQYVEIGHREGNTASQASIVKFGFQYHRTHFITWPDDSEGNALYYRLYFK